MQEEALGQGDGLQEPVPPSVCTACVWVGCSCCGHIHGLLGWCGGSGGPLPNRTHMRTNLTPFLPISPPPPSPASLVDANQVPMVVCQPCHHVQPWVNQSPASNFFRGNHRLRASGSIPSHTVLPQFVRICVQLNIGFVRMCVRFLPVR